MVGERVHQKRSHQEFGGLSKEDDPRMTAVDAFILNTDKTKVLLGRRKAAAGKGTWGFPGGHQRRRETIQQTLLRELGEEVGSEARFEVTDKPVAIRDNCIPPHNEPHLTPILEVHYLGGNIRVPEGERTEEWKWFALNELPEETFSGVKQTVACFLQGGVRVIEDWQTMPD